MAMQMIIVEFALAYGIKEALILTELCRQVHVSGTGEILFSVNQGQGIFPYLTAKQIRLALQNLATSKTILKIRDDRTTMDRSSRYAIDEKAYQQYLKTLYCSCLVIKESMADAAGGA